MFHAAKLADPIFACTPRIRSPSIFENPSTAENDDVISLRVKSIGLFVHSLRNAPPAFAGWSAVTGCPFITQPRE